MKKRNLTRYSWFYIWCALFVVSTTARAQDCETDDDCLKGYACAQDVYQTCSAPVCPEGEKCIYEPECEQQEYKSCQPLPCISDDECAEDMVCLTETYERCSTSGGSCDEEGNCFAAEEPSCETITESGCVPRYEAPCEQDADCGEGFNCVEQESCWCQGSTGTFSGAGGSSGSSGEADVEPLPDIERPGIQDAGADEPAPPPDQEESEQYADPDGGIDQEDIVETDCGCEKTGEFRCEMKDIACESADDCPERWSCEALPNPGMCRASIDEDGGVTTSCTEESDVVEKQCQPPYVDLFGNGVGRDGIYWEEGQTNSASTSYDPDSADGQSSVGAPKNGGDDDTEENAAPPAEADDTAPGTDLSSDDNTDGGHGGACSVASPGSTSSSGAWLLSLLGLSFALRRRRRG